MTLNYDCIPPTHTALIDTGPIRALLGAYRRMRGSDLLPADFARRVRRTFKTLTQTYLKAEGFNIRVHLKCEMLKTGDWKARVLRDLGGEAALTAWAARKAASDQRIIAPRFRAFEEASTPKVAPIQTETPPAREPVRIPGVTEADLYKTTRCRTDRDGLFRLAKIKPNIRAPHLCEYWQAREAKAKRRASTPRRAYNQAPAYSEVFEPIPLTSDELRGEPYAPARPPQPRARCRNAAETSYFMSKGKDDREFQATLTQLRQSGHFMGPSRQTLENRRTAARIRAPDP